MSENQTKVSVLFPTELLEDLKALARLRGKSVTETLHRCVVTELYFRRSRDRGQKVLTESPDGLFHLITWD